MSSLLADRIAVVIADGRAPPREGSEPTHDPIEAEIDSSAPYVTDESLVVDGSMTNTREAFRRDQRTTVTGTGERRTIVSATLPSRTRETPDRP
ncbi:hypothetical protein [Salinadaptatus halalkaliphilus]|uniref:hypothetical protein n=1 Tax=Salinadaptatus halalkaliphilus TaxID=2419781 RepID=UPI0011429E32|nr:hypothetical protein [Salinadaptatus halalkaliphilus]